MGRSKLKREKNKMTIYFDKRATEETRDTEAEESQLEQQKKEEAIAAVTGLVWTLAKPLLLMVLWNLLMPGLFGLATIGYLKAFGLWFLARIIFDKE